MSRIATKCCRNRSKARKTKVKEIRSCVFLEKSSKGEGERNSFFTNQDLKMDSAWDLCGSWSWTRVRRCLIVPRPSTSMIKHGLKNEMNDGHSTLEFTIESLIVGKI
ncbi:hypothetical protein NC652_029224 [Populus alba x Populus x berolinensis]|nr:hypothetical protein NC652_029214 [Populus alba x Populus x berolinensis]KAJ6888129.1 hypothetical protein NC652_029224 [Populus alba x Populus x berolinensis]